MSGKRLAAVLRFKAVDRPARFPAPARRTRIRAPGYMAVSNSLNLLPGGGAKFTNGDCGHD